MVLGATRSSISERLVGCKISEPFSTCLKTGRLPQVSWLELSVLGSELLVNCPDKAFSPETPPPT